MKHKFILTVGVISILSFFSFQTVIAGENNLEKIIVNKGFYDDITLSAKIKNNFAISRFSDYFDPSQYAIKKLNYSFLDMVHKLPSISELKILPVYGYFPHINYTKKASAKEIDAN